MQPIRRWVNGFYAHQILGRPRDWRGPSSVIWTVVGGQSTFQQPSWAVLWALTLSRISAVLSAAATLLSYPFCPQTYSLWQGALRKQSYALSICTKVSTRSCQWHITLLILHNIWPSGWLRTWTRSAYGGEEQLTESESEQDREMSVGRRKHFESLQAWCSLLWMKAPRHKLSTLKNCQNREFVKDYILCSMFVIFAALFWCLKTNCFSKWIKLSGDGWWIWEIHGRLWACSAAY